MVDHETKEKLNALSLEVFGASSRWQKLVNKGYEELVTEEVEEVVPADENGENGGINVVKKPVLLNGVRQFVTKRHSIETVTELMNKLKVQRDSYIAAIRKMQADAAEAKAAAEHAKQVSKEISGSAAL